MGVSRDCPIFWIPPIISGTGNTKNFKFCTHIHRIARNKSPLKISGQVTVGLLRDSRKFSGHVPIYRAHRAVIFAIARLSCFTFCLLAASCPKKNIGCLETCLSRRRRLQPPPPAAGTPVFSRPISYAQPSVHTLRSGLLHKQLKSSNMQRYLESFFLPHDAL